MAKIKTLSETKNFDDVVSLPDAALQDIDEQIRDEFNEFINDNYIDPDTIVDATMTISIYFEVKFKERK